MRWLVALKVAMPFVWLLGFVLRSQVPQSDHIDRSSATSLILLGAGLVVSVSVTRSNRDGGTATELISGRSARRRISELTRPFALGRWTELGGRALDAGDHRRQARCARAGTQAPPRHS